MPDVISNSSALQYLYQVEALNLLPSLFGQILVPEELARQRKVLADGLAREKNLAVAVLQRETENKQGTYKLLAAKAEAAQRAQRHLKSCSQTTWFRILSAWYRLKHRRTLLSSSLRGS